MRCTTTCRAKGARPCKRCGERSRWWAGVLLDVAGYKARSSPLDYWITVETCEHRKGAERGIRKGDIIWFRTGWRDLGEPDDAGRLDAAHQVASTPTRRRSRLLEVLNERDRCYCSDNAAVEWGSVKPDYNRKAFGSRSPLHVDFIWNRGLIMEILISTICEGPAYDFSRLGRCVKGRIGVRSIDRYSVARNTGGVRL